MSVDAVALFRPRSPAALKAYLDIDDESDESDGFYAEALDDGSVLVHTFQPYAAFEASPIEGRAWLSEFGEDLPLVHHDARGCLFFPDVCAPRGRTYDAVVAEIESAGIWIPAVPLTAEEAQALEASMAALEDEMLRIVMAARPGEPMAADRESMIALQKQAMDALAMQAEGGPRQGLCEDLFDTLVLLVRRTTPLVFVGAENHVKDLVKLADGTAVIHTTCTVGGNAMMAFLLAESYAHWVAEHNDARGVPSFGARHLETIRHAAAYDAALAALGDEVVFLQPQSLDVICAENRAEKKGKLRKLFGEGSDD